MRYSLVLKSLQTNDEINKEEISNILTKLNKSFLHTNNRPLYVNIGILKSVKEQNNDKQWNIVYTLSVNSSVDLPVFEGFVKTELKNSETYQLISVTSCFFQSSNMLRSTEDVETENIDCMSFIDQDKYADVKIMVKEFLLWLRAGGLENRNKASRRKKNDRKDWKKDKKESYYYDDYWYGSDDRGKEDWNSYYGDSWYEGRGYKKSKDKNNSWHDRNEKSGGKTEKYRIKFGRDEKYTEDGWYNGHKSCGKNDMESAPKILRRKK